MCHYINRVDTDTPVVVMEYSAYLHDHVEKLAQLLPPDMAFLLNIYDTHINPGMFQDRNDIFDSKINIKQSNSIGYVNERVLEELEVSSPNGWRNFKVEDPMIV